MKTLIVQTRFKSINWPVWLMTILTLAGIGISVYLMWGYTTPGATLSCGGSHGCDTVKNSEYARLMGLPLPLIGLAAYLSLLILLGVQQGLIPQPSGTNWTSYAALALFGLALIGILYSAYLTYLEIFVIQAICRWCVASAVIMVGVFLSSIMNLKHFMG